ncbi:MAG: PhoH family protein [Pseudomonadota bacterium]
MSLCGQNHEHIKQIEKQLGVSISNRGHQFNIKGLPADIDQAGRMLQKLYQATAKGKWLTPAKVHLILQDGELEIMSKDKPGSKSSGEISFQTKAGVIRGHTANQRQYLNNIQRYDINFAVGPAGTGKTFLAVASAVYALEREIVKRVILVRPAVEAGERLGFLPGDLTQKIEPYLRPLYDALFEMLGFERVYRYMEQNIIELAPLAYMRGRTLNESFIILDEAQNTTTEQMKMFLTRIGFGSKAIITGDITQIDLPKDKKSGLVESVEVLRDIDAICFTHFNAKDVVRHNLVQRIIEAYEKFFHQGKESDQ